MPDITETPQRRASDRLARLPEDISLSEIKDIKRKLLLIDTAFLRDDLAATDYAGHRKDHLDRRKSDTIITEYKVSGTKVIIGLVITFVIGLLVSGFITRMAETLR